MKKQLSQVDFVSQLSEKIRLNAIRPNVTGYQPLDMQSKFHLSQKRNRLLIGGNRSGKTVAGVVEDVYYLTGKHPYRKEANYAANHGGCRGRIIGVDFDNGIERIILPEVARWLPPSALKGGSWETAYEKGLRNLTLTNGSTCEFMSYVQAVEKFAGTSRHFVHYDEEPPEEIHKENKMRLMDVAGSWWMTLTPIMGMEWMYDEIYMVGKNNPDGDIGVFELDSRDNSYIRPEEIEATMSSMSKEDANIRVRGQFIRRGGLVFSSFDPDVHVIDPWIPPRDWIWYCSVDHGFNNPTAWLWHAVSSDNTVVTFSEHYERMMTVAQHAQIVQIRNAGLGRYPDYFVGDPALAQRNGVTGTSIFQEYADNGVPVMSAETRDVKTGINRMNTYLMTKDENKKPKWLITRNCENFIREIQRLRWKTWSSQKLQSQNNVFDEIHKKDDHACDSARYFFTFLPDLAMTEIEVPKVKTNPPIQASYYAPVAGTWDQMLGKELRQARIEEKWKIETADIYVGEY